MRQFKIENSIIKNIKLAIESDTLSTEKSEKLALHTWNTMSDDQKVLVDNFFMKIMGATFTDLSFSKLEQLEQEEQDRYMEGLNRSNLMDCLREEEDLKAMSNN